MSAARLVAVTLVRDTAANVRRFVEGNLAGGMDHLVVVLDRPDAEVESWLAEQPQVTTVVADDAWWGGERIAALNGRQRVVANLVREACAEAGFVEWLFFVDGDEVAVVDREVLAGVPDQLAVVRLQPLEAVAGGDRTQFKRLLTRPELRRLKRLGLVDKVNNAHYFHGHVSGKVGVRPAVPVYFRLHSVEDDGGGKVPAFEHPALRLLHHESPTFEEFVRKWTALAASGPPPGMRDRRAAVLDAFIALADEADLRRRDQVARDLYDEHVVEDAAALEAAGVLERIDVTALDTTSTPVTEEQREILERSLAAQARRPKGEFRPARHGGAPSLSPRGSRRPPGP